METAVPAISRSYKTHEPSFLKKLMQVYWVNPKSWLLDEFCINDEVLTIKTLAGKVISAPISELKIRVQTDKYERREVSITHEKAKLHFKEIDGMLDDEEWEEIFSILNNIPDHGLTTLSWITSVAKILIRK